MLLKQRKLSSILSFNQINYFLIHNCAKLPEGFLQLNTIRGNKLHTIIEWAVVFQLRFINQKVDYENENVNG